MQKSAGWRFFIRSTQPPPAPKNTPRKHVFHHQRRTAAAVFWCIFYDLGYCCVFFVFFYKKFLFISMDFIVLTDHQAKKMLGVSQSIFFLRLLYKVYFILKILYITLKLFNSMSATIQ